MQSAIASSSKTAPLCEIRCAYQPTTSLNPASRTWSVLNEPYISLVDQPSRLRQITSYWSYHLEHLPLQVRGLVHYGPAGVPVVLSLWHTTNPFPWCFGRTRQADSHFRLVPCERRKAAAAAST